MKKYLNTWALALCMLLLFPAAMAEEQTSVSAEQAKSIHNDLRHLRDTLEKAMNENDIKTILANVDQNVVFITMNGDVVTGRENLGNYYKKMMIGPNRVVDSIKSTFVADDLSVLLENDVAIAHGHSDSQYQLAIGKQLDFKAVWTATLVNRNSAWKVASFHYSVNVFDNPVLKAQNKFLWIMGIAGILLALIAYLLGRWRKKP